ncbi:MAG: 3-deoxy-D-manno-octulosonic acid transferase [Candidatus Gastranaerophilales bacterium]
MFLYGIITTILFFITLPFYYLIRVINGKYLYGWDKKMGFFKSPDFKEKTIMLHAVSVGEVIAIENLAKQIKKSFPQCKLIITTSTKTGQEIALKKLENTADFITYFPFDIPCAVNKFLKKTKPDIVLIAETEIWPTFAYICKKRNITLYTINARISDSTYKSYRLLKIFFKQIFKNYAGILCQSEEDRKKIINIGASENIVKMMGNLKFDVKKSEEIFDLKQNSNRVIIAGSTHLGEDEIAIDTFVKLKQQFKDIKLVLAPRHLNRNELIEDLLKNTKLNHGFKSKNADFENNDIIVLDTLGELGKTYSICDFAFIGGSFNKTGGHNPLEAIVYGKPVITGASIHNFKDIYWILAQTKAGKIVSTQEELYEYMMKLLIDKDYYEQACKDSQTVFTNQQGALNRVIDVLKKHV